MPARRRRSRGKRSSPQSPKSKKAEKAYDKAFKDAFAESKKRAKKSGVKIPDSVHRIYADTLAREAAAEGYFGSKTARSRYSTRSAKHASARTVAGGKRPKGSTVTSRRAQSLVAPKDEDYSSSRGSRTSSSRKKKATKKPAKKSGAKKTSSRRKKTTRKKR